MKHCRSSTCGVLAALAAQAMAALTSWEDHQINVSICTWEQPRAALIRDVVYLDGGSIWWTPGFDDESIRTPQSSGNFQGLILSYNLSESFSSDTNITGLLLENDLPKGQGGQSGTVPEFEDGGMLANDAQFFLYGGAVTNNEALYDDPDSDDRTSYQFYQYGPEKSIWEKGFDTGKLNNDVTRYVAYGAAVSAPSENKAWYFSGLTSPNHGPIFSNGKADMGNKAVEVSDRLITLDMETQFQEEWGNDTLRSVKGRSNAEAVWVPVGEQGILVILGGVVYPDWAGEKIAKSDDEDASEDESPEFMRLIDVYDVESRKWYQQETEKGPNNTKARGCAVVAHAADSSSFNIYYYGGYDGIHPLEAFSDEVWVLSLPSFRWTLLNEGDDRHARAGHKCFSPYPDQMMAFGGYRSKSGGSITCLDKGPIVIFNLTSGEWMDSYDPTKYSDYGVPDKVQSVIGGDASGGATATAVPSGDDSEALGAIFAKEYDMDKITTYYPYEPASETGLPPLPGDGDDDDDNGGGGLPKWVAPVLGVVLGLMLVTGLVVVFCLWRRRKIFKNNPSDHGTERIFSWIKGVRGQPPTEKAPTVKSSEESPASPDMDESRAIGSTGSFISPPPSRLELADTQVAELGDTSPPVELHDTGLSPVEVIQKHSHFAKNKSRSLSNPSYSSFSAGGEKDFTSTISHSSGAMNSNIADSIGVETPPPGSSPEPPYDRVTSGVSSVTERAASHLRQISETTVSSTGMHPVSMDRPAASRAISESTEPLTTPVSPPTALESPADDYISARDVVSPIRRSMFHESEEDMGKPQ